MFFTHSHILCDCATLLPPQYCIKSLWRMDLQVIIKLLLKTENAFAEDVQYIWLFVCRTCHLKNFYIVLFVNIGNWTVSFAQKAVNSLKLEGNSIALANLGIYRWAHQAVDTPVEHPLFPLIWQQFMLAYLGRTVTSSGLVMVIFPTAVIILPFNYC